MNNEILFWCIMPISSKKGLFCYSPLQIIFIQERKRHVRDAANMLVIRYYRLSDVRGEKVDILS